jgi:ketosteroid isomerase-like protein
MARAKQPRPPDPDRLVRRSAGDLHTEDARFEVSSTGGAGRWYLTDTARHDGLGLAIVMGPFATLDEVRGAIAAQRATPAGDDGPLPEPPAQPAPRARTRKPPPPPAPEPVPEPEPVRPPARITRARWRSRHDERDAVVALVHRLDDAWLSGDADAMADDLHESVVVLLPGAEARLEGRAAVIERHHALAADLTAWTEDDLTVDVIGASAVVRYRFDLGRAVEGATSRETGRHVWVLTHDGDRWWVAWRMTLGEVAGTA